MTEKIWLMYFVVSFSNSANGKEQLNMIMMLLVVSVLHKTTAKTCVRDGVCIEVCA